MAKRICPWWLGYVLASPLRRWIQDPAAIIGPYVREGMTVLEPGPGMGFFTRSWHGVWAQAAGSLPSTSSPA